MNYRKWNEIDCHFAQIAIELAWESKAASDARHHLRHKMIEIAIRRSFEFESAEANVVESFVVNAENFVGVFNQLMNRQSGIVWLNNSIGNLLFFFKIYIYINLEVYFKVYIR